MLAMEYIRNKNGLCTEIKLSWCIEDVLERAKFTKDKITRKEAGAVLELCLKRHDCNMGITWDMLDYYIGDVISERKG